MQRHAVFLKLLRPIKLLLFSNLWSLRIRLQLFLLLNPESTECQRTSINLQIKAPQRSLKGELVLRGTFKGSLIKSLRMSFVTFLCSTRVLIWPAWWPKAEKSLYSEKALQLVSTVALNYSFR